MSTIKYMTKADIQEINQASIKAGRNRTLEPDSLEDGLMEDTKYPILMTFLHNEGEVSVQIAIPGARIESGHDLGFFYTPFLDMTIEEFNDLEETEVDPDPGNLDGLTGWGDLENN